MLKSWLIAIVAVLLVVSPALAQSAETDVKVETKQGGIVVKKVIKNGKVVDEDVKVFGDIDEKLRRQVLEMVGKYCPGDGQKKQSRIVIKRFGGANEGGGSGQGGCQAGKKSCENCQKSGEKSCPGLPKGGFLFLGPKGDEVFGKDVRKHLEQALKEHGLGHGRHIFRFPGRAKSGQLQGRRGQTGDWGQMGERIRQEVEKAMRGHGLGHGQGRIQGPRTGRFLSPDEIEKHLRQHLGAQLPGARHPMTGHSGIRIFKARPAPKKPSAPRGDKSTLNAIRRLELNIQRMQRELEALKRDLGKPRPIRLERTGGQVRDL